MTNAVYDTNEGTDLNSTLGFVANSVIVDNYSQSWCYIPAAGRYVRPYTYGQILPVEGTQTGTVRWNTPGSLAVGPVGTGTCHTEWHSDTLPASEGTLIFAGAASTVKLGTTTTTTNGSTTTSQFVLPPNTRAICGMWDNNNASTKITAANGLRANGQSVQLGQVSTVAVNISQMAQFPVVQADTPNVTFVLNHQAGASNVHWTFWAILDTSVVTIAPDMFVTVVGGDNAGQSVEAIGVQGVAGGTALGVSVSGAVNPTQANTVTRHANSVGSNATITIYTAPVGGAQLHRVTAEIDSTVATQFTMIIAGTNGPDFPANASVFRSFEFDRLALTNGQTVQIKNNTTTAGTVRGMVLTDQ